MQPVSGAALELGGQCDSTTVMVFTIKGGRVVDPANGCDAVGDVHVDGERVADRPGGATEAAVIDAAGLIVCPGLIDMHVHLREPGGEHKETIETGTQAAAAGGFATVACMPNTSPVMDSVETIQLVRQRAKEAGYATVLPIAAITVGRGGRDVVDMASLCDAGAVAFSDDGDGVEDDDVMLEAFRLAAQLDAVIIQHCEYKALSAGGVMHAGEVADRLGLPGLDPRSEEAMIERDIRLVRETGARYHIAHVSTAKAVELVRRAKAEGLPVTTEVCPHHLLLTHEACANRDPNTKMHPPLRSAADVEACLTGLADGSIDCIATDHAPHAAEEKSRGFLKAPPGIVGLETSLALAIEAVVASGRLSWADLIQRMCHRPAEILGLPSPSLGAGQRADITLIDPELQWEIDPAGMHSRSRNMPFAGWRVTGKAVATVVGGQLVYLDAAQSSRACGLISRLN